MEDRIVDGVVGEVLATDVEREVLELTCHLCLQLEVAGIFGLVVVELAWAVQLAGNVELPELQRRLVGEGQQTFVTRGEGTLVQLAIQIGGAGITVTERGQGGESVDERI